MIPAGNSRTAVAASWSAVCRPEKKAKFSDNCEWLTRVDDRSVSGESGFVIRSPTGWWIDMSRLTLRA